MKKCENQSEQITNCKSGLLNETELYKSILDQVNASITVIEVESKRIIYANKNALEATKDMPGQYVGSVCYEYIHGRRQLCEHCILCPDAEKRVDSRDIKYGGNTYHQSFKIIEWNGRKALLEYTEDVTELEEQKEELGRILDHITIGVAVLQFQDGKFKLLNMNQTLCDLLNIEIEEINEFSAMDILNYAAEEYKEYMHQELKELTEPGTYKEITFRTNVRKKGQEIWLTLQARSFADENKGVLIYAGYYNVTQRKQQEEERNRANEELRQRYELEKERYMSDSQVLAYGGFNITQNIVLDEVRRGLLNPLVVHLSYDNFVRDISESIWDGVQREQFLQLFSADSVIRKEADGIMEQSMEYQRILPGGKIIWVKSSYQIMLAPNGIDILLFYACRNRNETKLVERMSSYLVNADYDMIGYVDFFDGSALMLYGEKSYMKPENNNSSVQVEDYRKALESFVNAAIVPEEREVYRTTLFIHKIKEELEANGKYEFVCHIIDQAGERRTKKIQYKRDEHMPNACFFTQVDITQILEEEEKKHQQLREAVEDAQRANQAKSDFLSRMSHDMRTPMNGIIGLSNLAMELDSVQELKDYIMKINASGEQLLGLINDTLDVSRIENGKLSYNPEYILAEKLLMEVVASTQIIADQKGVHFSVQKEGFQKTRIYTDVVKVTKIFINRLSNAVKFTPSGGNVMFNLARLGESKGKANYLITVQDDGIGMSKEFQKHMFEPFQQERTDYSTNATGTGLGTTIVKSLVDFLGGRIEIESELGKGTTVKVWMDFQLAGSEEQSVQKTEMKPVEGICRILLAEDHPINAEIAEKLLQKGNYMVDLAKNGRECADMFRESDPGYYDLILMDIRMPVMDGMEAAKLIRTYSREDAQSIPIIAMTANAYTEDVQKCLLSGMNGHLSKPIRPEKLYETLENYIRVSNK